jgi:hypothetical protein
MYCTYVWRTYIRWVKTYKGFMEWWINMNMNDAHPQGWITMSYQSLSHWKYRHCHHAAILYEAGILSRNSSPCAADKGSHTGCVGTFPGDLKLTKVTPQKSHSSERDTRSASGNFSQLVWNLKVHCHVPVFSCFWSLSWAKLFQMTPSHPIWKICQHTHLSYIQILKLSFQLQSTDVCHGSRVPNKNRFRKTHLSYFKS